MQIRIEKAADNTFIIEVPCKPKKDKKGNGCIEYNPDLKYTADDEKSALKIISEALKEIEVPEDEYGIGFTEAAKEPKEE
jgi:hypothetical protein